MPVTIATGGQTRWKDSFAPSAQVDLTLRSNGEEPVMVVTPDRTLVPAGITPPTVAATMADGGAGLLPAGNVAYLYCYASSNYPNVEADTAAGGFLWPKSNPSPVSLIYTNTASHQVLVTVATTTQAGIDKILIYRTAITTGATAPTYTSIVAQAGQVFYVGFVENTATVPTVTFTDNTVATSEEMEVDNFVAPMFWLCTFIDPYWYGFGNPDLNVAVTLATSGTATATTATFFSGRNGQLVTFDGITTGGFDGKGTFYFRYSTPTVALVSTSPDLSSAAVPGYTGTTTMRVRGYAGTLYRSKARNPFAWGYTEYQTSGDSQIRVTQTFAQPLGGYGVAMAVLPQQRLLKLDFERPSRCYIINVAVPLETNFTQATQLIDTRYIVTAHHSQFLSLLPNGQTALRGMDTSNFSVVQSDTGGQAPISDEVQAILRQAVTSGDTGRLFHGCYEANRELSCFWFKTVTDPGNLVSIDTCLLFHAPTGQWSILRDMDVTASATIYDPYTLQTVTLVGTASGQIAQAFVDDTPYNFNYMLGTVNAVPDYTVYTLLASAVGVGINGHYFDIYPSPAGPDRFWFWLFPLTPAPPATPDGGTLRQIVVSSGEASDGYRLNQKIAQALPAGYIVTDFDPITFVVTFTPPVCGLLPAYSAGTTAITITQTSPALSANQIPVTASESSDFGAVFTPSWALVTDSTGQNEQWARVTSGGYPSGTQTADAWIDPATLVVSNYPVRALAVGDLFHIGLINCEAQTYFQPSDTVSGQRVEVWSGRQNVSEQQWARLYAEFDETIYGDPFHLVQTKRGDNTTLSGNWTTATQVPTGLMTQFGIRFIERGYADFNMKSFTLIGR